MTLAACSGSDRTEGAGADDETAGGEEGAPVLGSARRPDPSPWVPTPQTEGAPAPTGEVAAVAPSGPHAAVRAAYVDFVRRLLSSDWEGIVETLAPQVGILGRPQTIERGELTRRIRQRIERLQIQGARVEDVLEPREIEVRSVDPDASRSTVVQAGDLLVRATPQLPTRRSFGTWQDAPQLSLVFRRTQGRWVVVATDF